MMNFLYIIAFIFEALRRVRG